MVSLYQLFMVKLGMGLLLLYQHYVAFSDNIGKKHSFHWVITSKHSIDQFRTGSSPFSGTSPVGRCRGTNLDH